MWFSKILNKIKSYLLFKLSTWEGRSDIAIAIITLFFSAWLMFGTFGYVDGSFVINTKINGDFSSHIPIIRSFSYGDNIPPEHPLLSGENMRYHFLFYFLVGMFEKVGVRMDIGLNIMSTLGMWSMMMFIYAFAVRLTKSRKVGWLAILFLVFNSSLSALYYFGLNSKLELSSISDVIHNNTFGGFGPYDDSVLSAFWSLNIFTNQRHLAFSLSLLFAIVWILFSRITKKRFLLLLLSFLILSWAHKAILLLAFIAVGFYVIAADNKQRKKSILLCFAAIIISLPGIIYLNRGGFGDYELIHLGFLYDSTTWKEFPQIVDSFTRWLFYWLINSGILIPIGLIGWVINLNKQKRKNLFVHFYIKLFTIKNILFLTAVAAFILANTIRFGPEVAAAHKLVNFTFIILGIYAGLLIVKFSSKLLPISIILIILLTVGGVLDFFPIINDEQLRIADVPENPVALWLSENTPLDTRILNITYDVPNVTIAGRKVFLGWPYFTWSLGYYVKGRFDYLKDVTQGNLSKDDMCKFMQDNKLTYIYLDSADKDFVDVNVNFDYFAGNFTPVYTNGSETIYSRDLSCK